MCGVRGGVSDSGPLPQGGELMAGKSTREEALELAYARARKEVSGLEPLRVETRTGALWHESDERKYWVLEFLGQPYSVSMPGGDVRDRNGTRVPLVRSVLLLHYLIGAEDAAPGGDWIDFRQLPGGVAYYPVFRGRVISRLTRMFQAEPPLLIDTGRRLGGESIELGDVGVKFPVFPKVSIVFALWSGDEELAPEGAVLFDENVSAYLSTEDAIVACEEILGALSAYVKRL